MSDDFVSLRILVVSEVVSDRAALRLAASDASVPIEVVEASDHADPAQICDTLRQQSFDVVFVDSRMPLAGRQIVLEAVRTAPNKPLYVLVGSADMRTREVFTDALAVDGVLAKPIDPSELASVMEGCVRARVPSRVLIVDDSATVRSVIRKVLQTSRYRLAADEAEEGRAALDRAGQERYDFVFLDCNMPVFDGFATLAALQRDHPALKVVMVSGTNDPKLAEKVRAAGAKDMLVKPFYAKDIDTVLGRLYGLMPTKAN